MKLLRIEEVSYKVLYVEESGSFFVYRKTKEKWEKYTKDWKTISDHKIIEKLENLLNESK